MNLTQRNLLLEDFESSKFLSLTGEDTTPPKLVLFYWFKTMTQNLLRGKFTQ